jgi:hypothetical protein
MVPGTTGGQKPSSIVRRHSPSMVSPGSASAIPETGSQESSRDMPVMSSTRPPELSEASP